MWVAWQISPCHLVTELGVDHMVATLSWKQDHFDIWPPYWRREVPFRFCQPWVRIIYLWTPTSTQTIFINISQQYNEKVHKDLRSSLALSWYFFVNKPCCHLEDWRELRHCCPLPSNGRLTHAPPGDFATRNWRRKCQNGHAQIG